MGVLEYGLTVLIIAAGVFLGNVASNAMAFWQAGRAARKMAADMGLYYPDGLQDPEAPGHTVLPPLAEDPDAGG